VASSSISRRESIEDRGLSDHEGRFIRSRGSLQSALLNFGLRSGSRFRCARLRPLADPTDRRWPGRRSKFA
jgi:Fe2+ transport system protein FeoA